MKLPSSQTVKSMNSSEPHFTTTSGLWVYGTLRNFSWLCDLYCLLMPPLSPPLRITLNYTLPSSSFFYFLLLFSLTPLYLAYAKRPGNPNLVLYQPLQCLLNHENLTTWLHFVNLTEPIKMFTVSFLQTFLSNFDWNICSTFSRNIWED